MQYSTLIVTPFEVLKSAVQEVLKDDGFQLPTPQAITAVKCAEVFLEWLGSHKELATKFACDLHQKVEGCIS